MNSYAIFPMQENDLPEVWEMECSQHLIPWSLRSFSDALNNGWYCRVARDNQRNLMGYTISMTAGDVEELLIITVGPKVVRLGVGKFLMRELIVEAKARQATNLFLEVRESNHPARGLYEQMGFKITGVRKNYYKSSARAELNSSDQREHALLMSLDLAILNG